MTHLQTDGWDQAVVVTYAELLESLHAHVAGDVAWQRAHPRQHFFIRELVEHFTEGTGVVSGEDQIRFIEAMCDTGESARYGHRPQESAAQEFADLVALHAKRQFEQGRKTLAEVKRALRYYFERTLAPQLNQTLSTGPVTVVKTPFHGQWEWCVALIRPDPHPTLHLEFGPTAVVENGFVAQPVSDPDYTKIFVTRQALGGESIDRISQTDIGLDEVLNGLGEDDLRLREALRTINAS